MKIKANDALNLVSQELDQLYTETWEDKGTIQRLQEEVRVLREEKKFLQIDNDDHLDEIHFLNDRLAHTNKNYSYSISQMYAAYVVLFIAVGVLVWTF